MRIYYSYPNPSKYRACIVLSAKAEKPFFILQVLDDFLKNEDNNGSTPRSHSQSSMEGSNIIGLFPSANWGTAKDEIIIIVAHWDTVKESPGI